MKKVLITGGQGFLGQHLKEHLSEDPESEVWTLDINGGGKRHFKKPVQEFSKYDEFDVVYHLAAITSVKYCEENRSEAWNVNVEGTRNILEQIGKDQKIVFSSSSHVYDDSKAAMKKEDLRQEPSDFYGLTKKISEDLIKSYSADKEFEYNIFRIFTMYGKDQPEGFLIPDVISKIKNAEEEVQVRGKDVKLSLSHIDDVLDVMSKDISSGVYNVCQGCYYVGEIYEMIAARLSFNDLVYDDDSADKYLCGDNAKISEYKSNWKKLEDSDELF